MRRLLLFALIGAMPAFSQTPSSMVVTTQWLAARLGRPDIVIVHVARDRQTYDAGHIPGARLLLLNDIAPRVKGIASELAPVDELKRAFEAVGVGNGSRVVLYGEEGNVFAARAWWTLDYLGHAADAALLDGTIDKWRAEGRPLTTDTPPPAHAKFTAHVRPGVLAKFSDVQRVVKAHTSSDPILIDSRPPEQFSGEVAGDEISRPGHIPGAVNLYWVDLLESPDDPQLLPIPDLRKKFLEAGASGHKLIFYCRSGMQSSFDYFVARFLGFQASMYDGSYIEWSNSSDTPVERGQSRR